MGNVTIFILLAIVSIVVLRRFLPIVASLLGIALSIGIGVWGWIAYDRGAEVALLGMPMNRTMFLGLIVVWMGLELQTLVREMRLAAARRKLEEAAARAAAEPGGPDGA